MAWMAALSMISQLSSSGVTSKGENAGDIGMITKLAKKYEEIKEKKKEKISSFQDKDKPEFDTGFYGHNKVKGRKSDSFYKHCKKVGNTLF